MTVNKKGRYVDPRIRSSAIAVFEQRSDSIVNSMNTRWLIERTAAMPHWERIRQAWEDSCVEFMVGEQGAAIGPTIAELERWKLLWMLDHFDPKRAFQTHLKLIASMALKGDLEFLESLSGHRHSRRGRPKESTLVLVILWGWLSVPLWMLSNQDRADLISHRFEPPQTTSEAIRKYLQRLCLLGWEKFSDYPEPPLSYKRYSGSTDLLIAVNRWTETLDPAQP